MKPIIVDNPLREKGLSATTSAVNPTERVRRRLNQLIADHKGEKYWTQRAIADRIDGRNQSWVSKICRGKEHGGLDLMLEDLDALAEALHTTAVELVRDTDRYEFVADLKPHEMTLLRQFRRLTAEARDAILTLVAQLKPAASRGPHVLPQREETSPRIRTLVQQLHRTIEEEAEHQKHLAGHDGERPPGSQPPPRQRHRPGNRKDL